MANAQYTMAQLVGTGGTLRFGRMSRRVDAMTFSFAGMDGEYETSMGRRSPLYQASGNIRTTPGTATATLLEFKTLLTFLDDAYRKRTTFDLFHGETTNIEKLYQDAAGQDMTNLVIRSLDIGERHFVGSGSAIIVLADFSMTIARVGP